MKQKCRIDQLLVERGLTPTRARAQALIMAGCVLVNDRPATKAGQMVPHEVLLRIRGEDHPYVGRGGMKLAAALDAFNVHPEGKVCLDVGASTGGFTDCLLQRGAAKVYAVDVGYGQLAMKLRQDPRVVVIERTNIRHIARDQLPEPFDLVVIDVSFISLEIVLPAITPFLAPHGRIIALIKPQFEVGKDRVGKGGIVRDPAFHQHAIDRVLHAAEAIHLVHEGTIPSPVTGADGNREFLALFKFGC